MQDKAYKSLPEHRGYTERHIEKLKADIETVKAVKPLINEDNKNYYPVIVNGKEYHNKEEAGQAIREAVVSNDDIMHGRERVIGSYRGLEMSILLKGTTVKVNLEGATAHYGELNLNQDVKASGNIVRLDNVIKSIGINCANCYKLCKLATNGAYCAFCYFTLFVNFLNTNFFSAYMRQFILDFTTFEIFSKITVCVFWK